MCRPAASAVNKDLMSSREVFRSQQVQRGEREREPSIWPRDGPETFQTSLLTRWACTRPHRGAGKFSWPKKQDKCSCVWMRCVTFILREVIFARTWFSSTKLSLGPTVIRGTNFFQSIIAHLSSEGVTWKNGVGALVQVKEAGCGSLSYAIRKTVCVLNSTDSSMKNMFLLYTSDQAKQALHLLRLTSSSLMGSDKWMFSWMTVQTHQTACTCSTEAADARQPLPTPALADACHWCRCHRRHETPPHQASCGWFISE